MRLAIINLTAGGMSGGYEKYLKNILSGLSHHKDIEKILCTTPKGLTISNLYINSNRIKYTNCSPFSIFRKNSPLLKLDLDAFYPDVIFIPMERYISYKNVPTVCMFRNMLPLSNIRHISVFEYMRNRVQKIISKGAVYHSNRIIAVSSFVSESIQRIWDIDYKKIGVVHHGVTVPPIGDAIAPPSIPLEWYGNFIFTAGAIEAYRGLEDLLFALKQLKQSRYEFVNVVIAGPIRPAMIPYFKKLKKLIKKLDLGDSVKWAGELNEQEMTWCYRNSKVFVITSRVEACPNTALEALSHGNLIISSAAQPMQEIFQDVAKYYKIGDTAKLAEAIIEFFRISIKNKSALSQKAINRAKKFSWENTVNNTVSQLKKVIYN